MRHVEASVIIKAPADRVYAILADFHDGHRRILPPGYFQSLQVEEGGVGAGTVINYQMRVLGQTRTNRARVTEPEPGRVLVETDLRSGTVTTFTVRPLDDGRRSYVTIATEVKAQRGVARWLEGLLTPVLLRPIYAQELALLRDLAEAPDAAAQAPRTGG